MTAVNCTKKILDQLIKSGQWPRPTAVVPQEFIFKKCQQFTFVIPLYKWMDNSHFIFFCIVWILSFIILTFNRQKYMESSATRVFIIHYIGVDFIIFITPEILRRIYEEYFKATANWYENAQCLKNYRNEIIFNQYPNPNYVYYPESISKLKLVLKTIYDTSQKFNHLRTCQLILHRIIIYFACTKPIWYKINITTKRICICYIIIDIIIIGYSPTALFANNTLIFNAVLTIFTWIFSIIHVIITILSLRAVWKFKSTSKQGVNEIKSFLWFSILPCTLDIICAAGNLVTDYWHFIFPDVDAFCVSEISNAPGLQVIMHLCDRIKMISPVLMVLFCISGYRRIIFKCFFFWCKPHRTQVQPISTTMAGNLLSLASYFRSKGNR